MTNLDRTLGPWTAPGLGLATGTWAMNGVKAATSDSAPSTDVVLVAVSLIMTGVAVGVTVNVVLGLLLRSRRPEYASVDEAMLWMLPTGICVLGLAVWPLLEGSLATIDWVLLVVGSLASGFILGLVSGTSIRRHITASSRPGGPPLTRSHY